LLHNNNQKFICKNVNLSVQSTASLVTNQMDLNQNILIPIAHGEGRYHADQQTLSELNKNNQVLFKYCDQNGQITEQSNPNGSLENIAGICNVGRNVFGMMPHPERASDKELNNTDGRQLFESILSEVLQA
jgi:phosphoribosylformylglycinamidine synthase